MTTDKKLKRALITLQRFKDMSLGERVEFYRASSEDMLRATSFNDLADMLSTKGEHKNLRVSLLGEALRATEHVARVTATVESTLAAIPTRETTTREALAMYLSKLQDTADVLRSFVCAVGAAPEALK